MDFLTGGFWAAVAVIGYLLILGFRDWLGMRAVRRILDQRLPDLR